MKIQNPNIYQFVLDSCHDKLSDGQIEIVKSELDDLKNIVARFIEAICDKGMLTEEEIVTIVRGY